MKVLFFCCKAVLLASVVAGGWVFISCQTTEKISASPTDISVQAIIPNSVEENGKQESTISAAASADVLRSLIKDITLSVISKPDATVKHVPFNRPYKVKAAYADGTPAKNFSITVSYPDSKNNDSVVYASTILKTESNGEISFTPPVPSCAANSTVLFRPSVSVTDPDIIKLAADAGTESAWKVRTDYAKKGGIICLVDYDSKGRPVMNNSISSSRLLMELINSGFSNIGNADFSREIRDGNQDTIYQAARKLVGGSAAYFIYGTVKYIKPVEKGNDSYSCSLNGDVVCLDMSTGKQLYSARRAVTAQDKAEWKVLDAARSALAKQIATAVIYGM